MLDGFMIGVFALFAGFVAFEIYALIKWRGGWRVMAAIPGVAVGLVIARIAVDVYNDPTAHNLWPFEIVALTGLGVVVLGTLLSVRLISKSFSHAAPSYQRPLGYVILTAIAGLVVWLATRVLSR